LLGDPSRPGLLRPLGEFGGVLTGELLLTLHLGEWLQDLGELAPGEFLVQLAGFEPHLLPVLVGVRGGGGSEPVPGHRAGARLVDGEVDTPLGEFGFEDLAAAAGGGVRRRQHLPR